MRRDAEQLADRQRREREGEHRHEVRGASAISSAHGWLRRNRSEHFVEQLIGDGGERRFHPGDGGRDEGVAQDRALAGVIGVVGRAEYARVLVEHPRTTAVAPQSGLFQGGHDIVESAHDIERRLVVADVVERAFPPEPGISDGRFECQRLVHVYVRFRHPVTPSPG